MNRYLIGTGIAFVASFILALVGNNMVQDLELFGGNKTGYNGSRMTWAGFWGLMMTVVFLPATFLFGGAFSLSVFKYPTIPGKVGKVLILTGIEAVFVFLAIAAWDSSLGLAKDVVSCGIFFCYEDDESNHEPKATFSDNYRVMVGTILFVPAIIISIYVFLLLCRVGNGPPLSSVAKAARMSRISGLSRNSSIKSKTNQELDVGLLSGDSSTHVPRDGFVIEAVPKSFCLALAQYTGLLLLCFALLIATSWVPENWESFTKNILIGYNKLKVTTDKMKLIPPSNYIMPEVGDATFKTIQWTLEANKLVLKIFPDCLIFYGFIFSLILLGVAASIHQAFARLLKQRNCLVEDHAPPKWWWAYVTPPSSVSKGGVLVFAGFIISLSCFLSYWRNDHNFHMGEPMSGVQKSARTLGHLANFLMGLMLLPVTKNSVLTSVFGISWEQVIFVHIWMGQVILIVIALHMLCFWRVFDNEAAWPQDILQVPMWYPANTGCADQWIDGSRKQERDCFEQWHKFHTPDSDNFTIQMTTVSSFSLFILTGFFARYSVRRENYELFHYLHHIFVVVFLVALLHAASSWYYLTGGLVLWGFDRTLRALKRSGRWTIMSITPFPDNVTRLELEPLDDAFGRKAYFSFSSGQYLYLNIPCLGPHEWHPFTISSAPGDGIVTCHIKAAPGKLSSTFTGRLFELAAQVEAKKQSGVMSLQSGGPVADLLRGPDGLGGDTSSGLVPIAPGAPLVVSVDGPYGAFLDVDEYDELLLLAGGIGFTPIHSILRQLRWKMRSGSCGCQRAHVMLAVQSRRALDPFLDTLKEAAEDDLDGRCTISVFVDNEPGFVVDDLEDSDLQYHGVPFKMGRLNPVPAIRELSYSRGFHSSHVFVCGPPGLAATADLACLKYDISFHKEVFSF
jgi:NAD(P)H-flavin reductase